MSSLMGQVGEVTFTVEIKRKDTGKIDTFNLIGKVTNEQLKEIQDGSHTLDSSKERGD
jgi:hypothetical protein